LYHFGRTGTAACIVGRKVKGCKYGTAACVLGRKVEDVNVRLCRWKKS